MIYYDRQDAPTNDTARHNRSPFRKTLKAFMVLKVYHLRPSERFGRCRFATPYRPNAAIVYYAALYAEDSMETVDDLWRSGLFSAVDPHRLLHL
jgi:hypothetical protein